MAKATYFLPGFLEGLELEGPWFGTTPPSRGGTYSVTNLVTDRAYDADATSTAELADVLGTLIADLRAQGIVI